MSKRKRRPNVAHAYLGGHERERAKRVAFAFGPAALISVVVGGGGRSQSDTRARKNHRRRAQRPKNILYISSEGRVTRSLPPLFSSFQRDLKEFCLRRRSIFSIGQRRTRGAPLGACDTLLVVVVGAVPPTPTSATQRATAPAPAGE